MNQREKLLAGIVGIIVSAFGVRWFVDTKLVQPLKLKDMELANLNTKLEVAQQQFRHAKDAEFDINLWRSLALPANPSTAQTIYASYLETLLKFSGIDKPSISPPQARLAGSDYTRHRFTVNARMDLKQLARFLVGFYKTDALHQIRQLDLKPELEKDRLKDFNVTIGIDAVSMRDADAKVDMPKPKNPAYRNLFVDRKPEDFTLFASKNPFQPTKFVAANVARVEPKRTEERDDRGNYVMTGVVVSDGTPQLWLTDKSNNKKMFLTKGDDVKIPGFNGKVVEVNPHEALFEIANDIGVVRLGKSLASWAKLPQTAQPSVDSKK